MNNQTKTTPQTAKEAPKRTPLDNFKLFYEELPLVSEAKSSTKTSPKKDRLSRRSRR